MTGTLFQGSNRPLWFATASALALVAVPAAAQTGAEPPVVLAPQGEPSLQTPDVSTAPGDAPKVAGDQQVGFAADNLNYDSDTEIVVAEGNVQMNRDAIQMRANKVTWNRKTGEVVAEGDVAIANPEGDTAYGERIVLTDSLRDGVVEDMLVVLDNGSRLAAVKGTRFDNGNIELENAAYTPCPVVDDEGCPKNPSWQIRAVRVMYDKAKNKVRYKGARVEIFGLPLIPLPGLSHPLNNEPSSGILVPEVRYDRTNGLEIAVPYYLRIAPDRDLTITPHLYTGAAPMIEGEFRALTDIGSFRINGYGTYSSVVPLNSPNTAGENDFRGYLESAGKFQLSPRWSVTYSGRIASDRTFLRRYDITRDDRLRSTFEVERIGGQSYLSIAGWATQTLRAGDKQGQQPIALPILDYRQRLTDPVFGGQFELQVNTLAIGRTAGQDTQRAFAGVRWDLRRLTSLGQEVTFTAMVRGDVYHSDENLLTAIPGYRGKSGWEGRGIAAAAVDMRWPFVGEFAGGTQTLTPRVQFVATPQIKNLDIPNEDSRAFDLEDSNLFAINRFSGYDRFEDGARVTYGVEWNYSRPGFNINSIVGQSYRLSDKPSLFPDGTGLTDRTSDIVGRTTVAYKDFLRLTHRFRLDKDSLAVRRNEFDATIGSRSTYAVLGYSRLNRDIALFGEDLQDREEVRAGGRIAVAKSWSIFGSAIVDLTSKNDDPLSLSDGFEPIRHRLGVAYDDDCLSIALTWRRDYIDTGDARRGNSFSFRVAFRNLGF
ncbi:MULTISPECIES: LPS-assembly protein LptD [unclassified Sphingopyxis]|uniref:LPS-assembly protein LptD n=1 Tax=unclassified Sphingopyxis TaxID=2614943 RepID=UPI00073660B8|nr:MULTISPECIES: LPS assembly protein LptD [unclassified Sphingopyxis]KTE32585.1 organic solvent tolerance protein [Sphingopyxis sp. HIX]KTE83359.1 organic solvent tolerance protein [Sphingopyxis sp. HXXIV]